MARQNPENLREIDRVIAALVIFSSDESILMGRKDPKKGGVYPDAWHIPGGGMEPEDEGDLFKTAKREGEQEVVGLQLTRDMLTQLPQVGHGATYRTLGSGERVWCKMEFNYFEVHLDKTADQLMDELRPGDDLVELQFFGPKETVGVQQIPGGKEFFIEAGYIKPSND